MTAASRIERGGAALAAFDRGLGRPILFQHGLGGAVGQVDEVLGPCPDHRRLTLECRAHGASAPGIERPFSLPMFTADVAAFLDARHPGAVIAGGVSMGAAIALRLAVERPSQIRALILVRPAWLFDGAPPALAAQREIAALLRDHPPAEARALFLRSATAERLARDAPANLRAMLGWFDRPAPAVTADLLAGIASSPLGVTAAEAGALTVPALVIGQRQDVVHPIEVAEALAGAIPGAGFVEVMPKAVHKPTHLAEVRTAIARFLGSAGVRAAL